MMMIMMMMFTDYQEGNELLNQKKNAPFCAQKIMLVVTPKDSICINKYFYDKRQIFVLDIR
jgi:hypothetical protein